MTKVKINGKFSLIETLKFYLLPARKPIRGSRLTHIGKRPRRAYNLANKF